MSDLPPPQVKRLIDKLQRALPLRAQVRAELIAASRTHFAVKTNSLRCTVTHVYDAGDAKGPMCQVAFDGEAFGSALFVLPIAHVSFDRGHPIARDVASYRRRRLESFAARRKAARPGAEPVGLDRAPA